MFKLFTKMWLKILLISVLCIFLAEYIASPKQSTTTRDYITSYDYPVEEHLVQTSDGYLLKVFRISHTANESRPAVLLLHGFTLTSDAWVLAPPHTGLAYMLADEGYDVWVGNQRGNPYARQHKTLATGDSQFWNFSFHEIGCYDLTAMMDYIRANTSQESLHYIGYSQGTTAFFALMATRPTYAEYLRSTHLLAPVVYMQRMQQPLVKLGNFFLDVLIAASRLWGYREVVQLTRSSLYIQLCKFACSEASWLKFGCGTVFRGIAGLGSQHLNESLLIDICATHPAGASSKQILHFLQVYNSGRFQQYDYGAEHNLQHYQQPSPPLYNLTSITTCVNLYYSNNDYFSAAEDVEYLAGVLQCAELHRISHDAWNHYDFLWSHQAKEALNDRIIEKIKQHDNK